MYVALGRYLSYGLNTFNISLQSKAISEIKKKAIMTDLELGHRKRKFKFLLQPVHV